MQGICRPLTETAGEKHRKIRKIERNYSVTLGLTLPLHMRDRAVPHGTAGQLKAAAADAAEAYRDQMLGGKGTLDPLVEDDVYLSASGCGRERESGSLRHPAQPFGEPSGEQKSLGAPSRAVIDLDL